jgi:hypothetical protein
LVSLSKQDEDDSDAALDKNGSLYAKGNIQAYTIAWFSVPVFHHTTSCEKSMDDSAVVNPVKGPLRTT